MAQRSSSPIALWALWIARLLLIVLPPLLLFGMAELVCWWMDVPRLADDEIFRQREFMRTCRSGARLIETRCAEERFEEPQSTVSVYVFGGSSVQGHPVGVTVPFASHMQTMLDRRFPGRYVVHNLGVACRDSIYVRKCAAHVKGDSSDIYVIYAGHNDFANFMVPNPRLRIFSEEHPALFELQKHLSRSRFYSQLSYWIQGRPKGKYAAWTRLPDPIWAEAKAIAMAEYQDNITRVIEQAEELGVDVVLVTVVSNVSEYPAPKSRWDAILSRERPYLAPLLPWFARYSEGIEHYRAGRALESQRSFKQARDLSMGGRAPTELNEWLREIAGQYEHVRLVDFERVLDRVGLEPGLGCDFFGAEDWCDQFHPNARTQHMIADEVVKALSQMRDESR